MTLHAFDNINLTEGDYHKLLDSQLGKVAIIPNFEKNISHHPPSLNTAHLTCAVFK